MGRHVLHLAFQEGEGDLVLRAVHRAVVDAVGLDEEVDAAAVVVVRPAGAAEHLGELLNGEPLDPHRQRVEDHLRGGEVDSGRQRRGGDDRGEVLVTEHALDLLPAAVIEPGVVRRGVVPELAADLVTAPPRVREDDRLAAVPLRRFRVELPFDELVRYLRLLAAVGEGDVSLDWDGSLLVLDERRPELLREPLGVPDGRREVDELGAVVARMRLHPVLAVVLQPRDEAVEPVAALALLQGVDLVDDDRPHVAQILPGPERVVDPLVGADDHVGVRVEPVAVVVHPRGADPDGHVEQVAVAVLEVLVFLVGERDERD
ncbi:hypothetical protein BN903_9 [Halorubrum sp. AJ67]|nr:hypothetical protein BN903_9 [Halorubrum sp. AJ67]